MEVNFLAMRANLAVHGLKRAKLPKQLHITRPHTIREMTARRSAPAEKTRPATVDEVRSMLQLVHGQRS